jgi:hypothetical protein
MSLGIGGAAFLRNLPANGAYDVNEGVFNTETERNDVPLQSLAFTGLGGAAMDARIPNNGILASVRVSVEGTLNVATAAVTPGYQWPWNLLKRITFNANGQTSLISAEGLDLRARRQRLYRNPTDPIAKAPSIDAVGNSTGASIPVATYPVSLQWDIPITHDEASLIGGLFAQSDQNYLSVKLTPAQSADLFSGAGVASFTATTVRLTVTFFDIPLVPVQGRDMVVIPNLAWLHGYLSGDMAFANTGDVRAPFIRTAGQLLAYGSIWTTAAGGHRPADAQRGALHLRRQPQAADLQPGQPPDGEERARLQRQGRAVRGVRLRGRQPGARPRLPEGRHRAGRRGQHPHGADDQRQRAGALRRRHPLRGALRHGDRNRLPVRRRRGAV